MSEPITDYCWRCAKVTNNRLIKCAAGIDIRCVECNSQIDFLHDEEDETPYFDDELEDA
jgi:hypothetical protein